MSHCARGTGNLFTRGVAGDSATVTGQQSPAGSGGMGGPGKYAWVILACANLAILVSIGLTRFGYTLLLPAMKVSLGLTNAQSGTLATANIVGYGAMAVAGGALGSRYGPRRVIVWGLIVTGLGMALTGFARSFEAALAFRLLTGIGSGATAVPSMAVLPAWFSVRRRGLAAGVAVGGAGVALVIMGVVMPKLVAAGAESGWRLSWYVFGAVSVAVALLALRFLRDSPTASKAARITDASMVSRTRRRQAWITVYRSWLVLLVGLIYMGYGFSFYMYMTFYVVNLIDAGLSQATAGTLFMVMGWLSLPCPVLWGWISDRISRRPALLLVHVAIAVAVALFGLTSAAPGLVASTIVFGLSAWSVPALIAAVCGDLLPPELVPAALGYTTLLFCVGAAVGPSLGGLVADHTGGFGLAYLLTSAIAVATAVAALGIKLETGGPGDVPSRDRVQ